MPDQIRTKNLINWKLTGFVATVLIVIAFPLYLMSHGSPEEHVNTEGKAQYVGRESCKECHQQEYDLWVGSHHDLAMDTAIESTVLGDFDNREFTHKGFTHRMYRKNDKFFVHTQGPDGLPGDFEVAYTFGYTPLQQYLVPFEGGRLQCLPITWDTEKKRWYHLADTVYHGQDIDHKDWLYWTNQGQNWNGMCADCHSTNLQKGFDPQTKTFHTTWSEIDVSCEACHGPASEHVEWAKLPGDARDENSHYGLLVKTNNITNREEVNLCARCHVRRYALSDFEHYDEDILNYMVPQKLLQPYYHSDGQILEEDYVYGSFTQSKMFEKGVKCSDCHDVHSTQRHHGDNQLCIKCHRVDIYDTPEHHFHKMKGEEGTPLIAGEGQKVYEVGEGALCINCHMPGAYYMGVDFRRDHSLRVPRPDLSISLGTPNACNQCHTDETPQWADNHIQKWYGVRRKPHYGNAFALAQSGESKSVRDLAALAENELFPVMVRATAVILLGRFSDSLSLHTVQKALDNPESLIRHSAVVSFQANSPGEYIRMLSPLLNDPVKAVRTQAASKLSFIPENQMAEPVRTAFRKALSDYEKLNLYASDFASGRHNLGILYGNLGKLNEAEQSYVEALHIDKDFYPAKVNLAMLYNQQGKNDVAEKLYKEILKDNPDLDELYYSLALLLAEKGNYKESLEYMQKASEHTPDHARIFYNMALLRQKLNQPELAEKSFLRALEIEPDNFDFLYGICYLYIQNSDWKNAKHYAAKMVETFPENMMGHDIIRSIEQMESR